MPFSVDMPSMTNKPGGISLAALAAVNLGVLAYFLLRFSAHGIGFLPYRIDLDVYRIGGRVWLHGGNLYGSLPPTASGARLPFSYPPAAAVLLSPLSLLPAGALSCCSRCSRPR